MKTLRIIFLWTAMVLTSVAMAQTVGMSAFGYGASATGGGNATPTLVSTASALSSALTASGNGVIIITSDITVTSCIKVKATNKTLLALPGKKLISNQQNATSSGILYFKSGSSNLILRNLTFVGPGAYDCDGWDNLCFDGVTRAWVDHCDFQDGCDGNFDNKGTTDNVTVSWCRFRYLKAPKAGGSGGSDDHRFSNLLGSSSSDKPSDGTFSMTWAYCWWDEGCRERMLRMRNADIHFLGCYWNSSVANYYIGPENAKAYVELCTFEGNPSTANIFKSYGGTNSFKAVNSAATKGLPSNSGSVSTPSYSYSSYASAAAAKTAVTDSNCGAGATLTVTTGGVVQSGCASGTVTNTYTVTFNSNGHGTAPAGLTNIAEGSTISAPTSPTAAGWNFGGWYKESGCVNVWNFSSDQVNSNITLYAKWTVASSVDPSSSDACFSMTTPSDATSLSTLTVTGGSISDVSTNSDKVLTVDANGAKFPGGASRLQLTLDNAITAGMTISVTYASSSSDKTTGLGVFDSSVANPVIDLANNIASKATGTATYTFTSSDQTYIGQNTLIITRNGGSGGIIVSAITITGCGAAAACTDPTLHYAVTSIDKTMGDAAFTNALSATNGLSVTYQSSNTSVATVSTSGQVTLRGAGDATITASAAEQTVSGTLYCEKEVSYALHVDPAPVTYSITYYANGGSGQMTDTQSPYEEGESITLLACSFTAPSGMTFNGWNTQANGSGTSYAPGDIFSIVSDLHLYAQWTATIDVTGGEALCWNISDWDEQTFTSTSEIDGLTIYATSEKTTIVSASEATADGLTFTQRLKLAGAGNADYNMIAFGVTGNCQIDIYAASTGTSARTLNVVSDSFGGNPVGAGTAAAPAGSPVKTTLDYTGGSNTIFVYSSGGGVNIYDICVTYPASDPSSDPTGLESISADGQYHKVLRNGQMYIVAPNGVYLIDGRLACH